MRRFIFENGLRGKRLLKFITTSISTLRPKKGSGKDRNLRRFGIDEVPIMHFFSLGIGGKGVFPAANATATDWLYYIDVNNRNFRLVRH
jgi:hypothetical protein